MDYLWRGIRPFDNRKSFFIPIEKRNIDNIDEIIKRYVKKGTTINTDVIIS